MNEGWTEERRAKFEYFRKHIETSEAVRENVFAAINTSFMQDGVLVYVKPGKVVRKPILVSYLADSAIPAGGASHDLAMIAPRVFAHLDRGAEAAIVEHYTGLDGHRYFTNAVSDLRLEPGARLSYCKIQMEGADGINIGTTRIKQARDAWSESFQFTFGGKLSRQDLHVTLDGENAEAIFDGLYMVKGKQHVDHFTSVDHAVPHTQSEQVYKGILADEARAVFNGRVHIHPDAQKSNASQLNNNLMLSRRAEVDTKPELDIEADDVKAAHGATIGRIDPEQIFYFQTRSVPKSEAIRMLARGYAHDVVFRIKNDEIRKALGRIVDQRFDEMKVEEAAEVAGV